MGMDSNLFFKNLVTKWFESLDMFRWQNFKLLFLGSLATFKRSLFLLIKYFWWLIFLNIILLELPFLIRVLIRSFSLPQFIHKIFGFWDFYIWLGILFLLLFFAILAVKPGIDKENFSYFIKYTKRFLLGFAAIFLFVKIIFFPIHDPLAFLAMPPSGALEIFERTFIFLLFAMIALFFLDSLGNFKAIFYSFINAIKMIFYFLPGVLGLWLIYFASDFFVTRATEEIARFIVFEKHAGIVGLIFNFFSFQFYLLLDLFFLSVFAAYHRRMK